MEVTYPRGLYKPTATNFHGPIIENLFMTPTNVNKVLRMLAQTNPECSNNFIRTVPGMMKEWINSNKPRCIYSNIPERVRDNCGVSANSPYAPCTPRETIARTRSGQPVYDISGTLAEMNDRFIRDNEYKFDTRQVGRTGTFFTERGVGAFRETTDVPDRKDIFLIFSNRGDEHTQKVAHHPEIFAKNKQLKTRQGAQVSKIIDPIYGDDNNLKTRDMYNNRIIFKRNTDYRYDNQIPFYERALYVRNYDTNLEGVGDFDAWTQTPRGFDMSDIQEINYYNHPEISPDVAKTYYKSKKNI